MRYIVSACLAGAACRYNGRHSRNEKVVRLVQRGEALPACPEQLAGFPTPRPPAELRRGDGRAVLMGEAAVADHAGRTVTDLYLRGAIEFLSLARIFGARAAVLKDRSPSCGVRKVTIDGRVQSGRGVAAAFLESEGLRLFTPSALLRNRPPEGDDRR